MIETNQIAGTTRLENVVETTRPLYYDEGAYRMTGWGAIIAGAFAAISAQVIFAVMGSTIGLSVIGATYDTPERGLTIAAGIWWLLTGLFSLFFGGWVAGRLCRVRTPFLAGMHGFLTWCTVTVASAILVAMAGGAAVGGSLTMFGNPVTPNPASREYRAGSEPLINNTTVAGNPDARTDVHAMSEAETKEAAKNAAMTSGWTLFALVLGAAVACAGGRAGATALARHEPVVVAR